MSRAPAQPAARSRRYQRGPHLRRRRKTWYAYGKPFPRGGLSLHTSDHAEAERRFAAELRKREEGRRPRGGVAEAPPEVPLVDAVEKWLAAPHGYTRRTKQSLRNRLLAFGLWLAGSGVTLASEITPELVDRWVTGRSAKVSRATVNRDLRAAKVCLRWCAARSLVVRPHAILEREELREPVRHLRRNIPDPDELTRILGAVEKPRYRKALEALAATGLRIAELRRLHIGSLTGSDAKGWRLRVEPETGPAATAEPTKGYQEREIPLAKTSADVVRAYLAAAVGARGTVVSERQCCRYLHAACKAAKVPRCGLHDLRRAFATEAHRAGVPLSTLASWLGHADVRTTERYISAYRSDREIVAPVPRALVAPAAPAAKVTRLNDRK